MNLFTLMGTIVINNEEANRAINATTDRASDSGSKLSAVFEKIGSAAIKVGKAIATGLAVGVGAIAALTKSSLDAYADYEQLVGGVETLFGTGGKSLEEYAASVGKTVDEVRDEYNSMMQAQDTVLSNADEAYKTAGMSANEYMETVTSFSASLIQSLDGDTVAAAEKANQAIIDMSDNANKMGSDITSIQNAYQGFAKQNYTMLDNLKLGYGGTKTEMERLLKDATAISNIEYDVSSYADVVDAIHVIQEEMGIAGTTAKEASSTISGSISSMKAAWQNLLVGFGNDTANLSSLIEQMINSIATVASNVVPRVEIILNSIASAIVQLAPKISEGLPAMFNAILPAVIDGAVALVNGLVQAMPALVEGIMAAMPALIEGITQIMVSLAMALPLCIAPIIVKLPEIAGTIMTAFSNAMSQSEVGDVWAWLQDVGDYASEKLNPIITDLQTAFTTLKDAVQPLIDKISEYVTSGNLADNVTTALKTGIDLLSDAYETVKQKIQDIVGWLKENESAVQATTDVVLVLISAFAGLKAGLVIQSIVQAFQQAQVAVALYTATTGGASIAQGVMHGALTIGEGIVALLTGEMTLAQVASTLWATTTGALTAAQTALNTALTANPIGLVVAAIAALIAIGVLLYKNWDTIKEKASELFSGLKEKFENIKKAVTEKVEAMQKAVTEKWDALKENMSEKASDIKEKVSTSFEAVKNVMGTTMQAAKDTVFEKLENMATAYKENGGGIKGTVSAMMEGVKGYYTAGYTFINKLTGGKLGEVVDQFKEKLGNAKDTVSEIFGSIKTLMSSKITEAKTAVADVFVDLVDSIKEKMNTAKENIKTALNSIKSFFSGLKLELPKIKLPHFKFSGEFDLSKGKVPKINVEWYAKGAVLNRPTVFGINPATGSAMVGGEAGAEAVAPIDVLQSYVKQAVEEANDLKDYTTIINLQKEMIELLSALYYKDTSIKINGKEFGRMVNKYA